MEMKIAGDFFLPVKARQRLHFDTDVNLCKMLDLVWFEGLALHYMYYYMYLHMQAWYNM